MRIIHCADLHLDSKLTAHLSGEKRKERRAELLESFRRMVHFGEQHQVEAVLIAGDLFDSNVISQTTMNTVVQIILRHPEICFYYLKGNHDSKGIFHESMQIPDNLKLFTDTWQYYLQPCRKGQVVIAGAELTKENQRNLYENLYLHPDAVNIVMLHGQETEYQGPDRTVTVPLREFKNRGIDYLALGHVHSYKQGQLDARGIWCYPGCLEGRGFDECGEHGFVLLEIDEETGICETEFVPFSCRNLYTVYVDVTGSVCTDDVWDRINQALLTVGYDSRHMIKLILIGERDLFFEMNPYLLRKRLEDSYYYLKIYDETRLRVDYKGFLTEESLKGEFVKLISNQTEISEEEKAVLIRYGILALSGEEIE